MQSHNPYDTGMPYQQTAPNSYGANTQIPKKHFNMLIIPLVLCILLLITSVIFGIWVYQERNTYKFNTDKVVQREVDLAVSAAETRKDNEFLEKEKSPLKTYKGPAAFGTVSFMFPKTWSAQVSDVGTGNPPLSGYLHPDYVPALDDKTSFAVRFEVVESPYSSELKKFDSDVKQGKVKVAPYTAAKVPGVNGSRITGEISNKKQGVMVLLPLRDKTLRVWTESTNFVGDLDKHILSSLTFVP